jgi:hypothetical protein
MPRAWRVNCVMYLICVTNVGVKARKTAVSTSSNSIRHVDTPVVCSPGALRTAPFRVRLCPCEACAEAKGYTKWYIALKSGTLTLNCCN